MTKNKKEEEKFERACSYVPVFVTESDLYHPVILRTAFMNNLVSHERYIEFINQKDDFKLSPEELSGILENLFGFCKGNYDEELIEGGQKTVVTGETVFNAKRYMGVERLDKEWVESGMCSQAVKETYKWGGEIRL